MTYRNIFNTSLTYTIFEIHHHYTRKTSSIFIPRVNHAYAQNHIRHNLIQTINNTPNSIIDKIHTHSLRGFLNYINVFIFGNYEDHCHISNLSLCREWFAELSFSRIEREVHARLHIYPYMWDILLPLAQTGYNGPRAYSVGLLSKIHRTCGVKTNVSKFRCRVPTSELSRPVYDVQSHVFTPNISCLSEDRTPNDGVPSGCANH